MEPLIVRLRTGHVSVGLAVVLGGVACNFYGVGGDDDSGMGRGASARSRVVDEDITSLDVAGRCLLVPAGASPSVLSLEAVAKVLGTNLLLPTRIPSAGCTTAEVGMATSKDALGDKVGTVTSMRAVTASLTAPVRVRRAGGVGAALMIGSAPVSPGVVHSSVPVVGEGSCKENGENANGFKHD